MDYRSHVGPKELYDYTGKYCFDLLLSLNLKKHHKFLDVGCGCLRVGKHIIKYLNSKNYTGIEPEKKVFEYALLCELQEDIIKNQSPKFIYSSDFIFDDLCIQDFIFSFDVFFHCGYEQLKIFLKNASKISNSKTKIIISLMNADGNPHETNQGLYNYKYASHANVYYDINQFIKIAESHGSRAVFLNKNEQQFFGSRMIFMLNKMIKFI